jgi:hypothetical protein
MEPQVIVRYGCEDGCVTVYGAKSEEGWLFWSHGCGADVDDSVEVGSGPRDWTLPKIADLSEALGKHWIIYNPGGAIHPDFLPLLRQAYNDAYAQLPTELRKFHKDRLRHWHELLWGRFLRHPEGVMQMGANLQVWLSDDAWYVDPAVRQNYDNLVKALDAELQRVGLRIIAERGSGNTIISIPDVPEESWDRALEIVLSELRKRDLIRREGCSAEFYRLEMGDPVSEDTARRLIPPHMGYSTQAYAVDLARLRCAFGSNDHEMLKAIQEKYAKEIHRADAWFSDLAHRLNRYGAPTVGEALAQIIGGQITGPDWAGPQFGYATELLCKHLGHWLGHGQSMNYIDALEAPTHFAESGLPLPIPGPQYRPKIRFLTAEQVRGEYTRLRDQGVARGDEDDASSVDEDVQAAREEFRSYLHQAYEKCLGLVTFQC